ncbi:MAG TPA: hypothetical protein VKC64_09200 [Burkholderiales bacterium]|nr:hypothetical protein [Burkholderiales bacterium]
MKHLKQSVALLPLLFALGCATTQSTSDAQPKRFDGIRSVMVAKNVAIPERPEVFGKTVATGALIGGGLGAAAAQSNAPESAEFKKFLADNRIDVKEIVRQEFMANLGATRAFPAVVAEGADAYFDLTIQQYGLGPTFSMSPIDKPLRPTLRVVAKLSTPDGKVLWENTEFITALNGETEAHKIDAYYANPRLTEEQFRKVARVVVKELLKNLGGNS